jgi:hypothetical protein
MQRALQAAVAKQGKAIMDNKTKKTDENCTETEATTEATTVELDQLTAITGGNLGHMEWAVGQNANAGGYGR